MSCSKPAAPNMESCDCTALHAFARKVPAIKKTSDTILANQREGRRKATVKVVDALCKYPEIAQDSWSAVEGLLTKFMEQREDDGKDQWSDQYRKIFKLPTYWMASWLVSRSGGKLKAEEVDATSRSKGDAFIREVFFFVTCCSGADALPKTCLDKHICATTFNLRADEVGNRLQRVLDSKVFQGSSADWSDFGPYSIEWGTNGKAISITHCGGEKTVIDEECVEGHFTKNFTFHQGFSDSDASVRGKKISKFLLRDYFEEGKGPHKYKLVADAFAKLAQKAKENIEARTKQLNEDVVKDDPSILPDVAAQKRALVLAQARVLAANKKAKLEQGQSFVKGEMKEEGGDVEAAAGQAPPVR